MADKITKDTIMGLIEEVLKEEQLNEKKYYTTKGAPAFDDDLKTYDGVGKMSSSPVFKGGKKKPNGTAFEKLAAVSNDTKVAGEQPLTFADLKAASEMGDRKHNKIRFNDFVNPDIKDKVLGTDDGDTDGDSDGDTDGDTAGTNTLQNDFKALTDNKDYKWHSYSRVFTLKHMKSVTKVKELLDELMSLYKTYKDDSLVPHIVRAGTFIFSDLVDAAQAQGIVALEELKKKVDEFSRKYDISNTSGGTQRDFLAVTKDINYEIKQIKREQHLKDLKSKAVKEIVPEVANKIKRFPDAKATFVGLDTSAAQDPKLIYQLVGITLPTSGGNYVDLSGDGYIWKEDPTGDQHFAISVADAKDPSNLQKLFEYAKKMVKRDKVEKKYSIRDVLDQLSIDNSELASEFETELKKLFDYDKLIKLNEDEGKLDQGDFEFLFNNFDQYYSKILRNAGSSKEAAEKLQNFRNLIIKFYNDPRSTNDQTKIMLSQILANSKATGSTRSDMGSSSGYKISSRSASGGTIDFQVIEAFGNSFPSNLTFEDRFGTFNKYIADLQGVLAGNPLEENVDQKFSKFIVLDMMQQILYDFEASSAGWVFESFLAFMAFGEAIGAGYGAGDFTILEKGANGKEKSMQGSAKLLQSGKTSQNFSEMKKNDVIKYVIGVKSTRKGNNFAPTKQGERTGKLEVYIVDVKCIKEGDSGKVSILWEGAPTPVELSKGRGDIKVPSGQTPAGVLNLLFLQENDFQDISSVIVKDIGENLDAAMNQMSSLKANVDNYVLNFSKENERKIYSDSAIKSYNDLKKTLMPKKGAEIFAGDIKESKKITANFLKKLISESFKR